MMVRKACVGMVLGLLLVTASTAVAQQELQLTNGDRLTGTLTGADGGAWVFAHAGGELSIAPGDIASFTSTSPIGIRLADGSIVAATVTTVGNQLQLAQADGSTRTAAFGDFAAVGDPADLTTLQPITIGLFSPLSKFWGATASLGFSNQSGNSKSRGVGAELELGRVSPKDRMVLNLGLARQSTDLGSGDLEKTVEKYWGSFRVDIYISSRFFVFGRIAQQRDQFQDIDLRSNYDAGLGYQLVKNANTDLRFNVSGGYRREAFTSGGTATTPTVGAGSAFRQVLGPAVFRWDLNWLPSTKDINDYRFLSDASLTTSIYKGLGFRVAARNEVNNNPPPGIGKHDMLFTTTLTYTIGQ